MPFQSSENNPTRPPLLYRFGTVVLTFVFQLLFRPSISGQERVPLQGPLVVVANHISLIDPPFIGWALPRPTWFMAAAELFEKPILRWILPHLLCFPVRRDRADARPVREAVRLLGQGNCVVIFPEGGIRLGEQSILGGNPRLHPGTVLVASLARSAVQPVIIRGTRAAHDWHHWLCRPRLSLVFGPAFCFYTAVKGPDVCRQDRDNAEQVLRSVLQAMVVETSLNAATVPGHTAADHDPNSRR